MLTPGYVYILTNASKTVLYVGVTSNLIQRIWEHKHEVYKDSFTAKYKVHILLYYEVYTWIGDAIKREKQIKGWNRGKKNALISKKNPDWQELQLDPSSRIPIFDRDAPQDDGTG